MMSIPVTVGNVVPLQLHLDDGMTGLYVRATVRDPSDATLTTLTLDDVGGGTYTKYTYTMPDLQFIHTRYEVFNDAGFTDPATDDYRDGFDIFTRGDDLQGGAGQLVGGITGVVMESTQVFGAIQGVHLIGVLEDEDELTGVSTPESITGTVEDSGITGEV